MSDDNDIPPTNIPKDDIPTEMHVRDSSGKSWTIAIPEDVQLEIAACTAMDELRAAIADADNALAQARDTGHDLDAEDFSPQSHARFATAVEQVDSAFGHVTVNATALMLVVSRMLGI